MFTQNDKSIIAEDFIKPEHIEKVLPLYKELVEKTKQEPLCIEYNLYRDQNDEGHFIFIEEWPDMKALENHCKTEHFRRLVPLIDSYQSAEGKFTVMDAF